MQALSTLVISLVAVLALATATDYCSSTICNPGAKHISCGHNGNFSPSCPSDAKMVNIDAKLKAAIVNAHNAKRNLVASGKAAKHDAACRMATMQWDDELAKIAALNVKQCDMAHDRCRNTDAFKYAGQNLAWMTFYGSADDAEMLTKSVDMWYDEVKDSKMDYIKSYPKNYRGPAIGHFTVMVADRNVRVGCAASTYSEAGAPYKAYLVACNYATTNMVNFPIYNSCSAPASGCTTGRNPAYPSLCSTSEVYAVNKWF